MPLNKEHACRLATPDQFDSMRRANGDQEHAGKKIDVIYGIKGGKSEIASLRYSKGVWSESDAKEHCAGRDGHFEPAKKGVGGKFKDEDKSITDYEYLLHHIEIADNGDEVIHHCLIYDHIANMFEQAHLWIENGKVYLEGKEITEGYFHIIAGLEPTQEIAWSNDEAIENGIKPKQMMAGMSHKDKAREW